MHLRLKRGSEIIYLTAVGGAVVGSTYNQAASDLSAETVSESIQVVLEGSGADKIAELRSIELMLTRAQQRQDLDLLGERVYLEWDLEDNGDWYRSEVLSGRIERGEAPRHLYTDGAATSVGVIYTRRNYFEAAVETAIPLTNPNGTNVTSGLTLYNCNDLAGTAPNKRANYADIGADVIDGTLPAPAHIEITNLYNNVLVPDRLYVALNRNSWAGGVAANHWLEAAGYSAADASGGSYNQVTINTVTYESVIQSWAISAAEAARLGGNYVHALVRLYSLQDARLVKFNVGLVIGTQRALGPSIRMGDDRLIQDLGVIRIPPAWANPSDAFGGFSFFFYGTALTAGDKKIYYDYIMLAPVDGYRIYRPPLSMGLALNETLVDNADNPAPYIRASGVFARPWVALGEPLMLYPGQAQRILCLQEAGGGTDAKPDRNISLRAWYRPRRRSL
jgi:hypothetical protein